MATGQEIRIVMCENYHLTTEAWINFGVGL